MKAMLAKAFPVPVWILLALYAAASLAHFVHNAEYIAFYPNMPAGITRETVYLVWLAEFAVGATGVLLALAGWRAISALLVGVYGALGLDGLLHYTLALCSEHTFAANLTIWSEAATGLALSVTASLLCCRRLWPRMSGGTS